jgi:hypothetical protein
VLLHPTEGETAGWSIKKIEGGEKCGKFCREGLDASGWRDDLARAGLGGAGRSERGGCVIRREQWHAMPWTCACRHHLLAAPRQQGTYSYTYIEHTPRSLCALCGLEFTTASRPPSPPSPRPSPHLLYVQGARASSSPSAHHENAVLTDACSAALTF